MFPAASSALTLTRGCCCRANDLGDKGPVALRPGVTEKRRQEEEYRPRKNMTQMKQICNSFFDDCLILRILSCWFIPIECPFNILCIALGLCLCLAYGLKVAPSPHESPPVQHDEEQFASSSRLPIDHSRAQSEFEQPRHYFHGKHRSMQCNQTVEITRTMKG